MLDCVRKMVVEYIGTFFLVFTVGATALLSNGNVLTALAIGFVLMVMVYAGGPVSGGHYNPAVSLAAAIRNALSWKDLVPYWIAQILGGLSAGFLAAHIAGASEAAPCPFCELTIPNVIIGEFLFTFALCYVVLLTATSKATEGNSYFGLAIGSTVTVGAVAVGGICMGAFNPAVAAALPVIKGCMCCFCWKLVCLTVLVNLIAGTAAAAVYMITAKDE